MLMRRITKEVDMTRRMVGIFTAIVAALLVVGVAWASSDSARDDSGSSSTQVPPTSEVSLPASQTDDVTGTSVDDSLIGSSRDDNGGSTPTTIDDNAGSTPTTIDDNAGSTPTTIDDHGGDRDDNESDDSTGTTIDDHGGDRDNSGSDDSGSDDSGSDDHGGDDD
jgi:hypothetical protein